MLVGDAETAGGPLVADEAERGPEHVEIQILGTQRRRERLLSDAPRFGLVARDQALAQPELVVLPALHRAALRASGRGRLGEQLEVRAPDVPLAPGLRRGEPAGTHVAVRGHVVDAEQVRGLLQCQLVVGRHTDASSGRVRAEASNGRGRHPGAAYPSCTTLV